MSEKQRGDLNTVFKKGLFRDFSGFEPIQLYHIYEREIYVAKALDTPVFSEGILLFFGVAGEAVFKLGKEKLKIRPHTVICCPADIYCSFEQIDKENGFRYAYVNLQIMDKPYISSPLMTLCDYFHHPLSPLIADNVADLQPVFSHLITELCVSKRNSSTPARGLLYQILILSYRAFTQDKHSSVGQELSVRVMGHTVYAIVRYVDEHLQSINNLADMAKDLGYSYNYLSHLFRKKTGMTIQSYVTQKKIERSVQLLAEKSLSITEIATLLNYDCIQSFSKAFKRIMNMSPTEYRMCKGIDEQ